jgi:electron transport complex protein RnfG
MKNMLKLGLVLALYAAVACVGLAFVYAGTAGIIKARQQSDLEAALEELFPTMDDFTDITAAIASPNPLVNFETVYAVWQRGAIIGTAVQATGPSYGGLIKVLTGIGAGADAKITRVKVLEHSDTPGLGANAASPSYYVDKANRITFSGQFSGKAASDPFEVKQDVVAITASTISSRAVTDVVKASATASAAFLKEGTDNGISF